MRDGATPSPDDFAALGYDLVTRLALLSPGLSPNFLHFKGARDREISLTLIEAKRADFGASAPRVALGFAINHSKSMRSRKRKALGLDPKRCMAFALVYLSRRPSRSNGPEA